MRTARRDPQRHSAGTKQARVGAQTGRRDESVPDEVTKVESVRSEQQAEVGELRLGCARRQYTPELRRCNQISQDHHIPNGLAPPMLLAVGARVIGIFLLYGSGVIPR